MTPDKTHKSLAFSYRGDPNKTFTRDVVCESCLGRATVRMLRGITLSGLTCSVCRRTGTIRLRPRGESEEAWRRRPWFSTNEFDLIYPKRFA